MEWEEKWGGSACGWENGVMGGCWVLGKWFNMKMCHKKMVSAYNRKKIGTLYVDVVSLQKMVSAYNLSNSMDHNYQVVCLQKMVSAYKMLAAGFRPVVSL